MRGSPSQDDPRRVESCQAQAQQEQAKREEEEEDEVVVEVEVEEEKEKRAERKRETNKARRLLLHKNVTFERKEPLAGWGHWLRC